MESLKFEISRAIDSFSNSKRVPRPFSLPNFGNSGIKFDSSQSDPNQFEPNQSDPNQFDPSQSDSSQFDPNEFDPGSSYVQLSKELSWRLRLPPKPKSQSEKAPSAKPLVPPRKKTSVNFPPIKEKLVVDRVDESLELFKAQKLEKAEESAYFQIQSLPDWLKLSFSRQEASDWLLNQVRISKNLFKYFKTFKIFRKRMENF